MLHSKSTAEIGFLFLVVFSLFVPFLIQLIVVRGLSRFREKVQRQKGAIISILIGFFPVGLLFILWFILFLNRDWTDIIWSGLYLLTVYTLFAYVYFHIFNMSETARRIRILAETHQAGKMVKSEMVQNYTAKQMIAIRVDRLVALGEIKLADGQYVIARGMLLLPAKIVFGFRKLLFSHKK